jgi:hypothetical protein
MKDQHRSTKYGVIFSSLEEALRGAEALIELVAEARQLGIKDEIEAIPPTPSAINGASY